jgi:hypothetical protein
MKKSRLRSRKPRLAPAQICCADQATPSTSKIVHWLCHEAAEDRSLYFAFGLKATVSFVVVFVQLYFHIMIKENNIFNHPVLIVSVRKVYNKQVITLIC